MLHATLLWLPAVYVNFPPAVSTTS